MSPTIFAADIGGTKTALGLFDTEGTMDKPLVSATVSTESFGSLTSLLASLDTSHLNPAFLSVGIAGQVTGNTAVTPNLSWKIDLAKTARAIGIERYGLINDLEATAHGIEVLATPNIHTVLAGESDPHGPRALIAAGTGLGEAFMVRQHSNGYVVIPSEGGHADFAPTDEEQTELLKFLTSRFGHVSYERVLSGPGLHNIYTFLVETGRVARSPRIGELLATRDPSSVIGSEAIAGSDESCVKALDIFLAIYGAEAGNLALKTMATGGVYLGGGIAPKILPKLVGGPFAKAFRDKGRLSGIMELIPVKVITEPLTALYGAANFGRKKLAGDSLR